MASLTITANWKTIHDCLKMGIYGVPVRAEEVSSNLPSKNLLLGLSTRKLQN